ncbi:MAG: hypothetical protein U1E46_10700 [Hyphomicrobiales bacterium]
MTNPHRSDTARAEDMAALYRQHYLPFQYLTVQFMTEHLIDVSRAFKGDMQAVVILAIIGQTQLARMIANNEGSEALTQLYPTNASRIADVTAIPRETVRRKLEKLRDFGWVDRDSDGSWFLKVSDSISQARTDLSELEERSINRYATFVAAFSRLVERYSGANGADSATAAPIATGAH